MNPESNAIMNMGLAMNIYLLRALAINLIVGGPITVALSQVALSIRELAINSRKEYDSNNSDYESLKWIASAFFYIGWVMIPAGVVLALRSF